MSIRYLSLALTLTLTLHSFSQDSSSFFDPAPAFNKQRFTAVVISEAALGAGSLVGLNELWYKDYPRSSFHSFNDNAEWLQMDKAGHVVTSYTLGKLGIDLLKWSGVERKKAVLYGGLLGTIYQGGVEVLDGFSAGWGFSWGDFAANTTGGLLATGQEMLWKEQRIVLKFSYHPTMFPAYRPELLGSGKVEKIFKDYNGQTYWMSLNIFSFLKEDTKFPRWLNFALGYGAEGMTGGEFNPPYINAGGNQVLFERRPKIVLALDADLSKIKTKCAFLRSFLNTFGFIKVPAPAMQFDKTGGTFSFIYF